MGRMKEELDKLANEIDIMEIATTIIETLSEQGVTTNRANFLALWSSFRSHELAKGLEYCAANGQINWEG